MRNRLRGAGLVVAIFYAGACGAQTGYHTRADGIEIEIGDTVTHDVLANDLPTSASPLLISVTSDEQLEIHSDPSGTVTITALAAAPSEYELEYNVLVGSTEHSGLLVVRTFEIKDPIPTTIVIQEAGFRVHPIGITFDGVDINSGGQSTTVMIQNLAATSIAPTLVVDHPFSSTIADDCSIVAALSDCNFDVSISSHIAGDFVASAVVSVGQTHVHLKLEGSVTELAERPSMSLAQRGLDLTRNHTTTEVVLTNTGNTNLIGPKFTVSTNDVSLNPGTCDSTITSGESCSVELVLTDAAILDFASGAAVVSVTASGVRATTAVDYVVERRPAVSLEPGILSFNDNNITHVLRITNSGEVVLPPPTPLTVENFGSDESGRITLDTEACSDALNPGASCEVTVELIDWPGSGSPNLDLPVESEGVFTTFVAVYFPFID